MDSELGEALIPIRLLMDQLDGDLKAARGKVESAVSGISQSIQKVGKVALAGIAGGVALIGTAIFGIANQAIPAASNLNEALNATRVVFGDAADEVQDFGRIAADVAGLSASEFNQMAAQTGAMLQNYGLNAEEAAGWTVDLGQRAADMASIFNTDVSEAMVAINAALRGEADPIERFGVSMNAAAVQAKALEMGLADSTAELDQAAMTQARLALLFEQTDRIAGDFVNTSGDLANATRVNQARWQNFMAQIGGVLLPIMNTFQGLLLNIGEKVFPIIADALAPIGEKIALVSEAVGGFLERVISGEDLMANLSGLIFEIATALGMSQTEAFNLVTAFTDFIARIQETIAALSEFLAPIWESITNFVSLKDVLIGLGIVIASVIIPTVASLVLSMLPIIATAAAIIGAVALLRNAWESDWGGIRTALTAWWEETGSPLLDLLRAWLEEKIPLAIQVLTDFWNNTLQPAMSAVWAWMSGTLIPFLTGTVFPWLKEKIPAAIQTLSDFWTNTLRPAIEAVWSWLSTVLIPFLTDVLFPWLSEKLTAAIQTLSDFWTNTLQPALSAVWAFISDDLVPLFESLWELFNVAGSLALEALSGLWENTLKPALEAVWGIIQDDIIPIFEALIRVINDELKGPLEYLSDTVLTGLETAFLAIKNAIQGVTEKIKALIEKLKKLELPDVFTPGSPTPFEMGLRGINKALTEFNELVDQNALINGPTLALNPVNNFMAGMDMSADQIAPVSYNSETTINTNQDPLRVLRASRHLDKLGAL